MRDFLLTNKWRVGMFLVALGVVLVGGLYWRGAFRGVWQKTLSLPDVAIPTIINGELVLPQVATPAGDLNQNLGKAMTRLGVISANLVPIVGTDQKLTGIRILGEMTNVGDKVIIGASPVVRFFDTTGKVLASKIGHYSAGWDFFGIGPSEQTLYDVTVDNPPTADKLEIVLNVAAASDSAVFDELKVASRSMEVKTASYQGNASDSAGEKVEYYSVSGSVVNALLDPVSDIAIYAWVKDKDNKVYAFARQDFKNDLLASGEKLDFKITLLPLKTGETYDSYVVAAWGKRYRLNL
ncbi:hypothetical protein HY440_01735 [Candidatus Microgenomates bacterium]|nr:hypothetical protein [Candidatus Microgenomates bacterium]